MKLTASLLLLGISNLTAELREWTNADGNTPFKGEVVSYNKNANTAEISVEVVFTRLSQLTASTQPVQQPQ